VEEEEEEEKRKKRKKRKDKNGRKQTFACSHIRRQALMRTYMRTIRFLCIYAKEKTNNIVKYKFRLNSEIDNALPPPPSVGVSVLPVCVCVCVCVSSNPNQMIHFAGVF
jgi:hypothetical protein